MSIDEGLVRALHVEALRRDAVHDEHEPHVIFQTSTIDALLDGAYDGDIRFGELRGHGDLGLGTLDACDGEMVALDGEFFQAAVDGTVRRIADEERTPFALVIFFSPDVRLTVGSPLDHAELLALLDSRLPAGGACHAVRVDGHFDRVKVRSVPRQHKPYPPLAEVAAQQQVFVLEDVGGTVVGFRFPDYAAGLNVSGYHLHFLTRDRSAGGHVLDCRVREGTVALDHSSDLHLELPPGVELATPGAVSSRRDLLDEIEGDPASGGA